MGTDSESHSRKSSMAESHPQAWPAPEQVGTLPPAVPRARADMGRSCPAQVESDPGRLKMCVGITSGPERNGACGTGSSLETGPCVQEASHTAWKRRVGAARGSGSCCHSRREAMVGKGSSGALGRYAPGECWLLRAPPPWPAPAPHSTLHPSPLQSPKRWASPSLAARP